MPAVSEMNDADKRLHGNDANKALYNKANRWRRELTLQQAYILRDALDAAKLPGEEKAVLTEWALESGQSVDALKEEGRWTKYIKIADIRLAFAEELITDPEWQMRIGTSHVKQAAIAREQDTRRMLTSEEKAKLLLACYHANWTVAEFKDELRRRGLKAPAKPKLSPPSQSPTRAAQILRILADHMETANVDSDLYHTLAKQGDKPIRIGAFLAWLGAEYRRDMPGATFTLGEEG